MISLAIYVAIGVIAALVLSVSMAGAAHLTSRQGHGYLHWIFYAMMLTVALPILLSGRDMTTTALSLMENGDPVRHPVMDVLQPLISLFMLAAAGERIISHIMWSPKGARVPVILISALILFWAGTVAAPAIFGAHPNISHNYLYALVIGIAVLLATGVERDLAFRAARNALLIFLAIGVLLIPVMPRLVLDMAYSQGLIPGVPRFAGLAAHPVSLGVLAQLSLLCLLACPFNKVWLNRMAWGVGLFALFMAQSKTSWISFTLCSACLLLIRQGPRFMKRATDPVRTDVGITVIVGFMAMVLLLTLVAMFGDVGGKVNDFLNSSEGAKLASLTGRDHIWAIAYEEWLRNPIFGYGPTIWNEDFRTLIGMPNATHGHNQFMDTLARAGSVGATALVLYALVLFVFSVRYIRVSGGLTLALFLALALRSISEVPLLMFGYGSELITHILLLMTLAAAASVPAAVRTPASMRNRAGFAYSPRVSLGHTRVSP
ncbi:MAG: O-antigen polymerase [Polaromonas sp.]|nr:O-antigen polymerase [Polaromonas sp.]